MEADDPTVLPLGVSPACRNVKFHLTSVRTRDGIQNRYGFVLPDGGPVTGLAAQKVGGPTGDLQVPIAFSGLGNLYIESPPGSGQAVQVAGPQVTPPANASMQVAAAFKNAYLAFTDLSNSKALPAVYNPTLKKLDPLSMKLVGQLWSPATQYFVGEVVCPNFPVGGNGHSYRCTIAGVSGANQPAFPTAGGAVVADGTAQWTETTPLMAQYLPAPAAPTLTRNAGAGAFAASRDVYVIISYVNGLGEALTSVASVIVNTAMNDQVQVTAPVVPFGFANLPAPYAATGYNVYEADVATGAGAPALASYKKVVGSPYGFGQNSFVNNTGAGVAPPTVATATVAPAGNICAGLRYMVVLFVNRNGYISGMTQAFVISYNAPGSGLQVYVPQIPIGPENTIARICAFTPAGQLNQLAGTGISNAGPYFWIPPSSQYFLQGFNLASAPAGVTIADVVNGVQMTSTVVNDNVSTTATFNFTDDYLKATLNDVSAYFRKIQVSGCSDIFYSQTLRRMFFAADSLPSGWYVSLAGDPESVYGDTGLIQAAENNGENRTAVREYSAVVYLMKEKSGHTLEANADDPSTWNVRQQWTGSGPCGPRAVDVCTNFMAYAHRSGAYIFKGGQPFSISKEIPAHTGLTWKNINWNAQKTIWLMIDDESKEIRIGVPYGQSLVPNIVLKCNYEESPDFLPPIHFSPYVGKEIASGTCYKWSIDDIAANVAIRAERTLSAATIGNPPLVDPATQKSQILFASSNPDGAVAAVGLGTLDDNGAGIDSFYETACPTDIAMPGQPPTSSNLMRPSRVGGVQANIDGAGSGTIELLALRAVDPKQGGPPLAGKAQADRGAIVRLKKEWIAGIPYSCGARMTNERIRMRISNCKRPGVGFDLKYVCIYGVPIVSARAR